MTEDSPALEDVARLLAVLVMNSFDTQSEAIEAMSKAGMKPNRIADLLGTTPGTVKTTVKRAKRK
jgi:DNA-binding CsgD family transcriptional regulator